MGEIPDDKMAVFRTATDLNVAEGELFGLRPEHVARTLMLRGLWLHIDAVGHETTIKMLRRMIKATEAERDEEGD